MQKLTTWSVFIASLFVALMALAGSAPLTAAASPSQSSTRSDGSYQVADWNDRVCCRRGWHDWFTSRGECRRTGGDTVANRNCRDNWNDRWDGRWQKWTGRDWNARVCCKAGRRDWWTSARECRNSFGYETSNRECRDDRQDDRRICCKRGRSDWWATDRECRRAGGYETSRRECRND
ncbi:MAG: hypothetical protein ABL973_09630 [Micropepsaceae bacterium]